MKTQTLPYQRHDAFDPQNMAAPDRYKFLIGSVVPRPIAFVSTQNAQGEVNLAPFSFFNAVASEPASLMFSVTQKRDGGDKDTFRNIRDTGEFVINTVSEWLAEPMNQCSAEYPYGVSEMEKVGLTPCPSLKVKPPRVFESPVHFECRLYDMMQVGKGGPGSAHIIVGEVVAIHVAHELMDERHHLDLEKLQPLARLAGAGYGTLGRRFELERPTL